MIETVDPYGLGYLFALLVLASALGYYLKDVLLIILIALAIAGGFFIG